MFDVPDKRVSQSAKDKAQLLTILSSMSEGVIATDEHQGILMFNAAAETLLGFPAGEAIGKPLWEVVTLQPVLQAASGAMLTGQKKTITVGPTNNRHLEVTVCKLPLVERRAGVVIVAHDITEAVRYDELRKEFVANVSHELRTPLTVIKGFVETLLDGGLRDNTKALQYLAIIGRHTDQLTNLVTDLLDLSQLESYDGVPGGGETDVAALVRKVAELNHPSAQKKNHTLTVDTPAQLPVVQGNPRDLERAVGNLVQNAIKYTPAGGRISIVAKTVDRHVNIEVSDNGIGIPADDIPRIFERFYRVDRSRSREMGGTGLGLSIVKHVVQNLGGLMEVTSVLGAGSTFRCKLPIASENSGRDS